jgi:hypothetical protein
MYCETDEAFYAYWQWCEEQLSRWEYEQELANFDCSFDPDSNSNHDDLSCNV